jgi:O-6-methylguanine DNA methyltransferase
MSRNGATGQPSAVVEDVAHAATVAAPWGPIELATTERGLVALDVLAPRAAFDRRLEARIGRSVVRGATAGPAGALLDRAVDAVEAFLERRPDRLAAIELDLRGLPAWDLAVLAAVRRVSFGQVTSYGRIARAIGRPGAARAVGGAVGRNPTGLAIPCHRVIAGDGSLGGYGGDWYGTREQLLAIKLELLTREGVRLPATFDA